MRLTRLDLTRYGVFTDHRIDFGERPADAPDLHIVFGPNEAGKSTLFSAYLDLLYGIEPRSRFNFLHPYPSMRVGGLLEIDGVARELTRVKSSQNSLLDGNDQPISDAVILGELGGVDRDAYMTMFSLDDDSLEAGGESILASKGDLGQLLFSGSAGLSDLSRTLGGLREEVELFYRYRARSGELVDLKARLADLKAERDRIDTIASEYARLVETRDQAAALYEEGIAARGRIQARIEELQRQVGALPRLAALRGIKERLAPFADLPEAPAGWVADLPGLQKDDVELETRARGIESEIATLAAERDGIVVDERALGLAERTGRLLDLRARYITADEDIPERRLNLREADLAIAGLMARMDRDPKTDPHSLLLGASRIGGFRDLIETRSGIEASRRAAESEASTARSRLDEAQAKLADAGAQNEAGPQKPALMSVLSAVRADDHVARRKLAERARDEQADNLRERMAALAPWTGDAEELLALPVPEAHQIEHWKASHAEIQKRHDRHLAQLETCTTDIGRLEAELEAIGEVAGAISDSEAASVRAAREEAWAVHRRALDEASADAFEAALRHDDIAMNARLGHGADIARLNQTSQALIMVRADLERATQARDAAAADLLGLRQEISAAVRMAIVKAPDSFTLADFETWLGRREKALESRTALRAAERDIRAASEDGDTARRRLVDALTLSGAAFEADAGLDNLIAIAETVIERETVVAALRSEVDARQRDLDTRERDLKQCVEADEAWNRSWADLCTDCWLGEGDVIPTVSIVGEVLKALGELRPVLEQRDSLADRIAKMENDQKGFAEEANAVAQLLGLDAGSDAPLDVSARIKAAVDTALSAQAARAACMQRLDEAEERLRAVAELREIHVRRKAEMMDHFGAGSLVEVDTCLRNIERRRELQQQALDAERDIIEALGAASMDEAESALDAVDRAAVDAELAELRARFDDQDTRTRDLFTEHSKAADRVEAVGGDDAVAKIEARRRTTLLEIEDGALGYLRRRVGIAAAEQALRAYRDEHRSSMMTRASQAFKTISRGAYASLATQPDKETELLVAVGANDGSKIASALSKGTRFQLYLALRVAGYHEFVQVRRPLPFIADDIMETFDDDRAEEAFRLFAEMAEVGQVIYLTHHRHLCEIAQRACPGARVHELPATGPVP